MKQKLMSMVIGLGAAALMAVSQAQAGLFLDFEDLSGAGSIPTVYSIATDPTGFTWDGGWQFATDAGNTYVFGSGLNLTIRRSNGGLFSLENLDFSLLPSATSGSVTLVGSYSGTPVGTTLSIGTLGAGFSTFQTASLINIDTLTFSGSGWRMDNFNDTVAAPVPEPATLIAGALLLLPFGASTLRILRKHRAA